MKTLIVRSSTHLMHLFLLVALVLGGLVPASKPTFATSLRIAGGELPGSAERFYKVTIGASGIYALTYESLSAAGLPVDTLDPATFQLFEQGQEVARQVTDPNGNGRFDAGEAVLFYGRAVDTDYTDANIYWLTYGYAAGLAMVERPAAPDPGLPAVTTFRETIHLEQNKRWNKSLPLTGNADRWYWDTYSVSGSSSACKSIPPVPTRWPRPSDPPLTVNTPGVATGAFTGTLTPRIRGGNDIPVHTAVFSVNNTEVGQAQFSYKTEFTGSFDFSQSLLIDGTNIITLTAPCPTGSTLDIGVVNWFDLTYQRTYAAPATGQFHFAVDASQPSAVTLTGLPDVTAQVYDITLPRQPLLLTGAELTGADLAFAHTLTTPARYIAAGASQYLAPASIALDAPSQLRAPAAGADWIVITHRDFITEAERLAAHRRLYQHYRTAVVDVQDVYDEFNGGLMDQEAIRAFLRHAYETWPRPAPRFVVLLGDGHYDPRGRSYNYNGAPFFIPPYLAPVDPFEGMAAADNRFVAYDPPAGQPNPLPFMALGRLPANALADATAMVDKIIAYETTPAHADWNATAIFVADNPDSGGIFPDSSNLVATDPYYLPGYTLTTSNPISLTLAADTTETVNFGFQQPPTTAFNAASASLTARPAAANTIQGRVWEDLNADGTIDASEGPLPNIGICVYQDPNFNGKVDATDPLIGCTASDSNGDYRFEGLDDDHYLLVVNELDPDLPSTFQRRSLYCDRTVPTDISSFFCTQDGDTTRLTAGQTKDALSALINTGALFVNYHGHASVDKWADEDLLRTSDLTSKLTNIGRYPIMLPMTCLEGQYIDLFFPSMGESIVRMKDAGAVASWSPTGKGTSNGHEIIWTAFYEAIFENGERLIGPATTYAKEELYASNRTFKDLIDTYILFGDPAMPLDLPAADLWVEKGAQPATAWQPGQAVTYTLTYGNAGVVTATNVQLTDTLSSDIIDRDWAASDPGVTLNTGPAYTWGLPDLAPGAGGVITVTGVYSPALPGFGTLANSTTIASDAWERPAHLPNNTAEASVATEPLRVTIGGYIFKDRNNNQTYDPGVDEAFEGVPVTITDNSSFSLTVYSNAQGLWSADLPPGIYTISVPTSFGGSSLITSSPAVIDVTTGGSAPINFGYVAPTGLGIKNQHAVWLTDGAKVLWETTDESLVQEFNIYRNTSDVPGGDKVNSEPILPKAPPGEGASYEFIDRAVTPGASVYYWIRVVSLNGDVLWYRAPFTSMMLKTYLPLVVRGK